MRFKRLFLLLPLVLIFTAAGCDSDNSSNAAAPPPEAEDTSCPCFTAEDIRDDAQGKSFFGCVADPKGLGISLDLAEGQTEFVISTSCPGALFGDCDCVDGVRNVVNQSVTQEQYFDCVDIVVNAIRNEFGESMCLLAD